jgi:hypothetical protein
VARKFIVPIQDASLYQEFPLRNTGFDEILEVGKSDDGSDAIRSLIQFDVTNFLPWPSGAQVFLNLRVANIEHLQQNQVLEFWTVAERWDEGTGYFYQDLVNSEDGVSWEVKDVTQATWSLAGGTTGSLFATYSFSWLPTDIRLDVTQQVQSWLSGSNNGMMIKLSNADETNSRVQTNIKFFSRNTHTVYPPTLEAVWVDQVFRTDNSCGLVLAGDEFEVLLPDMKRIYVTGSVNRIRVNARSVQPVKSFFDRFRFANDFILQSGSMYSIVDAATNATIIPFDSGSLLSADNSGSYFDLKIENMYRNRTYKVLLAVPKSWGTEIIDTGHRFRVI